MREDVDRGTEEVYSHLWVRHKVTSVSGDRVLVTGLSRGGSSFLFLDERRILSYESL